VVLYEMATGKTPFGGKTVAGVLGSILTESPAKPSALNKAVPAGLNPVILKTLEKDRERRYASVSSLAADLQAQSVQSEATAGSQKTRRWMLAAAGAGAAGLAGAGFLARHSLFPSERKIRIAVLPFENIGRNPQEGFFADGLHQDMISVINRLYPDRIAVIARTSVKRYQAMGASVEQVGRDLHVDYVVEGGVQRDRSQAHVTARLIRVRDQTSLWNATYDRDLGQVMAVQAEIARAVAQGVGGRLQPDAQVSAALMRPLNAGAHEAYLRGDYAKAVQLDPGYAAAFTGLANQSYYPGLFGFEPPVKAFPRMVDAAARALELDPTQGGAHASMALGKLHLEWNWSAAEEGFHRARRLNPADGEVRHFYGHYLLWSGQGDEAARECRRGLEVDPYNPDLISCIGWHELCAGHQDKALEETRRALALDPKHGWALLTLGWIYEQRGKFQEALAALRESWDFPLKTASLGHAFARSGNRRTAEKILNDLLAQSEKKYVSAYDIAVIYSGLDDRENTFKWLDRAYAERAGFLTFVSSDPRFKPLRQDPPFQDLLRRMRFPKTQA
jgi:TolB-like protein/Tfp pilus assembly protein PilF